MPNTRRRRFSVQKNITARNPLQSSILSSHEDSNLESASKNNKVGQSTRSIKNPVQNSSKNSNNSLIIVKECEISNSSLSTNSTVKSHNESTDKNVTASSSNIDLFNILSSIDNPSTTAASKRLRQKDSNECQTKRDSRQVQRDRTPLRRDKYPGQHRVKVRSPKRPIEIPDSSERVPEANDQRTTGTIAIDWDEEVPQNIVSLSENVGVSNEINDESRLSVHCLTFKSDLDDMCRICHSGEALSTELGPLISACSCRGTVGRVHVKCLEHWLTESGKSRCELCGTRYITQRVHRYGVPRSLLMWILSQNTKQLMVDSLGIMLMSPLAVLAAWLTGRTLAGLMSQESHVTPWPLASTFVLACMTLVCYYCWIVSAATRHALGWWLWYRSQYEVRLEFQGNQE